MTVGMCSTTQKMKSSIKFPTIWSYLLKKSLMEDFIFFAYPLLRCHLIRNLYKNSHPVAILLYFHESRFQFRAHFYCIIVTIKRIQKVI